MTLMLSDNISASTQWIDTSSAPPVAITWSRSEVAAGTSVLEIFHDGEIKRSTQGGLKVRTHDAWEEASAPLMGEDLWMSSPRPLYDENVKAMLTDRVEDTVHRLLRLLERQARQRSVPVMRVEVEGSVDPEEDVKEVVVTQWVRLTPEQALDYWDQLGAKMERWTDLLPAELATILSDRIRVEVWWEADDDVV